MQLLICIRLKLSQQTIESLGNLFHNDGEVQDDVALNVLTDQLRSDILGSASSHVGNSLKLENSNVSFTSSDINVWNKNKQMNDASESDDDNILT